MANIHTSKVYEKITASGHSTLSVEIQKVIPIANGYAQVAAVVSRSASNQEIASAFATATGGLARIVDNSLFVLANNSAPVVRFVASKNIISKPFNPEEHKVVTAGVAIDTAEQIWRVEGEGDNRRVLQESADDLEELLAARRSRGSIATASTQIPSISLKSGDYACFLDTASGKVGYGFAYQTQHGTLVVDRQTLKAVPVETANVLEGRSFADISVAGLKPYEAAAQLGEERVSEIVGYLRKAYPKDDKMFSQLESLIHQH
jgi:hypothetical protein